MTYKHLLTALGITLAALIIRILSLSPTLNWFVSLAMVLIPGAIAAWTMMLSGAQTTRWRLRHSLKDEAADEELDHLDNGLQFLVQNAGMIILETNREGLFLEAPQAFAGYAERLIPGILPGGRLIRQRLPAQTGATSRRALRGRLKKAMPPQSEEKQTLGERWPGLPAPIASLPLPSSLAKHLPVSEERHLIALGHPPREALLWGLQEGRTMRVYLVQDVTGQLVVAATIHLRGDAPLPPGRWRQIPSLPFLEHFPFGVPLRGRVSDVLPRVRGPSIYSTESRLLYLPPPAAYESQPGYRTLGTGVDGAGNAHSLLAAPYDSTLLSVNAVESFLDRQTRNDARAGRAMVVISPHRALLKKLAERIRDHVLVDMENAIEGGHVPILTCAEQGNDDPGLAVKAMLDFLAEQGLDQSRPQILEFARHVVVAVIEAARVEERDAGLLELYAISRGPNSLYAFLSPRSHYWQSAGIEYLVNLVQHMKDDLHDFQVMAMLDALRTTLIKTWQVGTLNHIVQQPFPNFEETLRQGGALLCVLHDRDFPENDRYLRAMFEMAAFRAVQATLRQPFDPSTGLRTSSAQDRAQDSADALVSVYLHSPTVYSSSTSLDRWLSLAQHERISLLIDLSEQEWLSGDGKELRENSLGESLLNQVETKLLFRCPEILANRLARHAEGWALPCPLTELAEIPENVALARLPDGNGRWFSATLRAWT